MVQNFLSSLCEYGSHSSGGLFAKGDKLALILFKLYLLASILFFCSLFHYLFATKTNVSLPSAITGEILLQLSLVFFLLSLLVYVRLLSAIVRKSIQLKKIRMTLQ